MQEATAQIRERTELADGYRAFAVAAAPRYGFDRADVRLLSISENGTFLLDQDGRKLVMRVHRPGYHSREAIESELAWMAALAESTPISTPGVVAGLDGSLLTPIQLGAERRFVSAFEFVEGVNGEAPTADVGFRDLGVITAQLHEHVETWRMPAGFTRFRWDLDATLGPQARWGDWRAAPGLTRDQQIRIGHAVDTLSARLDAYGMGRDRFGLVHADLRLANLMVHDATITVIDFDDSGWSWYLADLGAVVSFVEHTPQAETMIGEWVCGYRSVRALDAEHRAMIPTFVMLRRVMLTAWIGSHPEADSALAAGDFVSGTAEIADRYCRDRTWLAEPCQLV
ncbi:phosphotransferase enzyme family protein [Gordonia polyisoprenivorans]|uniref:phosphotransferase enzyme family protein n=1 Tax=Gordonia polyisoprenivorans TaxID=84595 RepID=UPI001FCB1E0D|nr:phosphotransferase [Gordonia polyisoprenivorans]